MKDEEEVKIDWDEAFARERAFIEECRRAKIRKEPKYVLKKKASEERKRAAVAKFLKEIESYGIKLSDHQVKCLHDFKRQKDVLTNKQLLEIAKFRARKYKAKKRAEKASD